MRVRDYSICIFIAWISVGWLACPKANAGLVITLDDASINTNSITQTVFVEVYLDLTDALDGGSVDVGNFQVLVELDGPSVGTDVKIVGVSETASLAHPQAEPLDFTLFSDSSAQAFTFNFGPSFQISDEEGLFAAELEIDPFATGDYQLEVVTGIGKTEILDGADFVTQIGYETSGATISFTAVPEPSCKLALVASLIYANSFRRKKTLQTLG